MNVLLKKINMLNFFIELKPNPTKKIIFYVFMRASYLNYLCFIFELPVKIFIFRKHF
jgi:hypothetical protein